MANSLISGVYQARAGTMGQHSDREQFAAVFPGSVARQSPPGAPVGAAFARQRYGARGR